MNNANPKAGLELVEDPHFEQLEWRLQRIAWFLMAVVVFLGVLGLFAVGPVSSRTITSADGALKLEYDRFDRWQAPSTLRIELRPTSQSTAHLWISGDFLQTVKVESVVPPAKNVEARDHGMVYTFDVRGSEPLVIVFHLQTQEMGSRPIRLRANDGPVLQAPHWVYP